MCRSHFNTLRQFKLLGVHAELLPCNIVATSGTFVQGPILVLKDATKFENSLNILSHGKQVNSCRSNHMCRSHLVGCNNNVFFF